MKQALKPVASLALAGAFMLWTIGCGGDSPGDAPPDAGVPPCVDLSELPSTSYRVTFVGDKRLQLVAFGEDGFSCPLVISDNEPTANNVWHQWSPDGDKLYYTHEERRIEDVWWSPAGDRIAIRTGLSDDPRASLLVGSAANLPAGPWYALSSERITSPAYNGFSPDSRKFRFAIDSPDLGGYELHAVDVSSLPPQDAVRVSPEVFAAWGRLVNLGSIPAAVWSPDSSRLAFMMERSFYTRHDVLVANVSDVATSETFEVSNAGRNGSAAGGSTGQWFSPDSRWLLYQESRGTIRRLVVLDVSGDAPATPIPIAEFTSIRDAYWAPR